MKEYIQDSNTLRLMIMYSQFADVNDVVFAFNVLRDKDFEKSLYITKAINYFDQKKGDSVELTEAFFPIRCMNFIKSYYKIKSKKDIKALLESGTSSEIFENASNRMLKNEMPRPSLLGFKKTDPELSKMHNRLFQMDARPRILLIAQAIKKYVMDGKDSAALMACAYKLVHDAIMDYSKAGNKEMVVQIFYDLMQQAKYISDK